MATRTITLPTNNIVIVLGKADPETPGAYLLHSASISSDLIDDCDPQEDAEYIAACNALESLILAHAVAGINVGSPAYVEGIETAVDKIANYYT